jgi:hypothetical protein
LSSVTVTLPPGNALVVLTDSVGGIVIENVRPEETPPPGAGVATETVAVPTAAMSLAGIAACRTFELVKVVGRLTPFHRTTDVEMKLLPFTVRVNAAPPAPAKFGESEVTDGTGFTAVVTVTGTLVAARV